MKTGISIRGRVRGDGGYLFVDLLTSLALISLVTLTLFAGVRRLTAAYHREREALEETIQSYEALLWPIESGE